MSEDTEELLTGRAGEEARQGYTPLQHAVPDPDPEPAIDPDSTLAKHFTRPPEPPPVHRDYFDVQTGEATPSNQTLEIERAAADVASVREQERQEIDRARNEALNRELDDATQTLDVLRAAEAPHVDVSGPEQQPQPQEPDYTPQIQAENLPPPQVDPEVLAAFQNPKVRQILEQASQGIEQQNAAYQQQLANAALTGVAAFAAAFPELNGIPAENLVGAVSLIARTNPDRARQIAQQYDRVSHLVQQQQQVAAQQQQQQQAAAAENFRQFAMAHDAKALAKETPETLKAIRTTILEDAKQAGISEKELHQAWDSVPALRHSFFQDLAADGAKWRLAQRSLSRAASRPVPHVQRPGVSEPVRIDDGAVSVALARLNAPGGAEGRVGLKNAAALVSARRGGRG
jgi:hypothetical protein